MKGSTTLWTLLLLLLCGSLLAQQEDGPVLLMPIDHMLISNESRPVFYWLREDRAPVGSYYQIRIFEGVVERKNNDFRFPLIDRELREGDRFEWPQNMDPLQAGQTYSWTVRLLDNNRNVLGTGWVEPQVFHVRDELNKTWDYRANIPESVKITAAGTGESTGVVALLTAGNSSIHPVELEIGPYLVPSESAYQSYLIPQKIKLSLLPNESKTIELEGHCLDIFKQPFPFGADLPEINTWIRPNPDHDLLAQDNEELEPAVSQAQMIYDRYWYFATAYSFYRFFDQLHTPYHKRADYERSVVMQHVIWKAASDLKNKKYKLKHFSKLIKDQAGFNDWKNDMGRGRGARIDEEINALWKTFDQINAKATYLMGTSDRFRDSYHSDLNEILIGTAKDKQNELIRLENFGSPEPSEQDRLRALFRWNHEMWNRVELIAGSAKPEQEVDRLPWPAITAAGIAAGAIAVVVADQSDNNSNCSGFLEDLVLVGDKIICGGQSSNIAIEGECPSCIFQWSTGSNDRSISLSSPGAVSVIITDDQGCEELFEWTVSAEAPASLSLDFEEPLMLCAGRESIEIEISTCEDCIVEVNGDPYDGSSFITDEEGAYQFRAITSCGSSTEQNIQIGSIEFSVELFGDRDFCAGSSTTLSMLYTGDGNPELFYYWNGLIGESSKEFFEAGPVIAEIRNNNCVTSVEDEINAFELGDLSIEGELSFCAGSNTTLEVVGIENCENCSFLWNISSTESSINVNTPGTYEITVTDENACSWTNSVQVTLEPELDLILNGLGQICAGTPQVLLLEGACENCTYEWSTGASTNSIEIQEAGTYSVFVSNDKGCEWDGNISVIPAIAPNLEISGSATICPGASTELYVLGNCLDCNFLWSNGATGPIVDVDEAGLIEVEVTDQFGCVWDLNTIVDESTDLDLSLEGSNFLCLGNSTTLAVEGTCENCSYQWSNNQFGTSISVDEPGVYSVNVQNDNNCSWSASINVISIENLELEIVGPSTICTDQEIDIAVVGPCPDCEYQWSNGISGAINTITAQGTYEVSVSNAAGCSWIGTTYIELSEQPEMALLLDTGDCLDGNVIVSANTNCDDCSYLWSNNSTEEQIIVDESGIYTLTLENADGCSNTTSIDVIAYPETEINIMVTQPACAGSNGSVFVDIQPDASLFTVIWSDGFEGQFYNGLAPGIYDFTIMNNQIGCGVVNVVVLEESDTFISTSVESTPPFPEGSSNGNITIALLGNVSPPFTVFIGDFSYQTTQSIINLVGLESKAYEILIVDANGCQTELIFVDFSPMKPAPESPNVSWNFSNPTAAIQAYTNSSIRKDDDVPLLIDQQQFGVSYSNKLASNYLLAVYQLRTFLWSRNASALYERSFEHEMSLRYHYNLRSIDNLRFSAEGHLVYRPKKEELLLHKKVFFFPSLAAQWSLSNHTKLGLRWNVQRQQQLFTRSQLSLELQVGLKSK